MNTSKKKKAQMSWALPTLEAIYDYHTRHGYAPGIRDLCRVLSISSTSVIVWRLDKLEARGWLKRARATPRGMALTPAGLDALNKPGDSTRLAQLRAEVTALQNEAESLKFPLPFGFKAHLARLLELTQEAD